MNARTSLSNAESLVGEYTFMTQKVGISVSSLEILEMDPTIAMIVEYTYS